MSAPYSTITSSSMLLTRRQNSFSTSSVGTIWGQKAEIMSFSCRISPVKILWATHWTSHFYSGLRVWQSSDRRTSVTLVTFSSWLRAFYVHEQACWSSRIWTGQPFLQSSGGCTPSLPARSQTPPWAYCTPIKEEWQYIQNQNQNLQHKDGEISNSSTSLKPYFSNAFRAAPVPLGHIL